MKRQTLKERLAQKLLRCIASGLYPLGGSLPTEMELARRENLSRQTVRGALAELERLGVISRTPHTGTKVISVNVHAGFERELSSFTDLKRLAGNNQREILEIREIIVSKSLAGFSGLPAGEAMIRVCMVRKGQSAEDLPIAWTSEYIDRKFRDVIAQARLHPDVLMIDLIASLSRRKCAEIRQRIEATVMPAEAAAALKTPEGSPCLRIFRRYLDDAGKPLLTTVSYHPSQRYAFNLNVRVLDGRQIVSAD